MLEPNITRTEWINKKSIETKLWRPELKEVLSKNYPEQYHLCPQDRKLFILSLLSDSMNIRKLYLGPIYFTGSHSTWSTAIHLQVLRIHLWVHFLAPDLLLSQLESAFRLEFTSEYSIGSRSFFEYSNQILPCYYLCPSKHTDLYFCLSDYTRSYLDIIYI